MSCSSNVIRAKVLTALQDLDNTERRKSCLKFVNLCPRNCGPTNDDNCCGDEIYLDDSYAGTPDWVNQYNKWLPWAGANAHCGTLRTGAHLVRRPSPLHVYQSNYLTLLSYDAFTGYNQEHSLIRGWCKGFAFQGMSFSFSSSLCHHDLRGAETCTE